MVNVRLRANKWQTYKRCDQDLSIVQCLTQWFSIKKIRKNTET